MKEKIAQYFLTLWYAFIGRNPYRIEFDKINCLCDDYKRNYIALKEVYCKVLDQMQKSEKCLYNADVKLVNTVNKLGNYQQLVEKLRERINEKDLLIERIKSDYQNHLKAYNIEINDLREQLNRAQKS